jgi:hypothetical protein
LSWNVATGQAIMTRLDALKTSETDILKRTPDATATQDAVELKTIRSDITSNRENLADWFALWKCLLNVAQCYSTPSSHLSTATKHQQEKQDEQQWAAVVLQVLAASVLPLCYGVLGAGAAVARNLWNKMRDSLLERRDILLAWGQLAQGAVIGACIGLFVSTSGAGTQNPVGFTGAVSLTPSALSFIAGFGVEGVFIALEGIIKRVFNIPEQKP